MLIGGPTNGYAWGLDVEQDIILPVTGRLVGTSVKLSGAIQTGTVDFVFSANLIPQAGLTITQADFAGGSVAFKQSTKRNGELVKAGQRFRVQSITSADFSPVVPATLTMLIDTSAKA